MATLSCLREPIGPTKNGARDKMEYGLKNVWISLALWTNTIIRMNLVPIKFFVSAICQKPLAGVRTSKAVSWQSCSTSAYCVARAPADQ